VAKTHGARLRSRTIYLDGKRDRTSIRMEPPLWEALREIAAFEGLSISKLVAGINQRRDPRENLSSAVRVYIVEFYRSRVTLG
jgi:predicted DNA-binding ribbon-helix-helix protein